MEDLEDTVISPQHACPVPPDAVDGDTVILARKILAREPVVARPTRPEPKAQPVDSPALPYRIRVGNQEPIPLDAPVYIGRKPSAPRISSGAPPRLVRVPSVLREVSSTHVEVRQQGSSVIVTDLRSTNATLVLVPGIAPLKLRQGESVVVSTGTVVDIGDGNRIEILPTQRLI